VRLIHLTDPHLSSLEGQSFFGLRGKRRSGYLTWTYRRQSTHRRDTLERLTTAIRAEAADQVVLSGDLVQIGLEEEIREAGEWLAELAAPQQIFFVPGNHDVYARDSWTAVRRHWNPVLPGPVANQEESPTSAYPFSRDLGKVRLIGLSSACVTPVFSARGALGQDQIERITLLLRETRESGRLACLAIHHPPLPHMAAWRKALKEIHTLKALIAEQQPSMVCCGHLHRNIELAVGATRVYCTASASSMRNASYRIFDIETDENAGNRSWRIRMRLKSISADGSNFIQTGNRTWNFTL